MRTKEKLYLDTSVPSAYFDERLPDRQRLTQLFWAKISNYDLFVSEVTVSEIKQTLNSDKKDQLLSLIKDCPILVRTPESDKLASRYVEERIIPQNYLPDAYHVSIASTNNVLYIVSWNFDHLVNVKTRQMVSLVNLREGYRPVEIVSPPELVS